MKRLFVLLLCVFGSLAAPLRAEVELSFDFYHDQLSPMGEWAEVDGYGYVWHPNDVDEDWAPYTDGYWSYTDAGWTWVSYEDWGGITYHYGRWTFIDGFGWCWVPGYEWGPAWVSWRKSEDYVGWAPLPPECDWEPDRGIGVWADVQFDIGPRWYNFCHFRDFGAPVLRPVLLPRVRNVDFCFSTISITNISYNRGYGCVFNGGFDYDYVRARCNRPVPTLRLVQNTTNIFINNNQRNVFVNAPRGNTLIVAAPRVAVNARNFTRKPAIRRTFDRSVVTRGWNNLEKPDTRDRLVSKMRSETKGLTPTNAPARPVRQEALAVVPKDIDLDARPAGFKRATAERPSRNGGKPGESGSRVDPATGDDKRPNGRGESAALPTPDPDKIPGRQLGAGRENAGKDENRGGLRQRPGRDGDATPETQGVTSREANEPRSGKGARPEKIVQDNVPSTGRVTAPENRDGENKAGPNNRAAEMRDAQENARRQAQENAEKNAGKNADKPAAERMTRGNAAQENAAKENAARQNAAQENNAAREAAERQAKQREQAEAAREGGLRAQRQREAAEGAARSAEMQRNAQENAQEKARQNAARENAARAEMQRNAQEKAQRENAARQNAARDNSEREQAAAAAAARRAQMQNDNAERMEKQRRGNDQAEAAQRQAAQREAAQRAAAERQQDNARREAAERQQDNARRQGMERQQENAQRQAAQRQAEAQQERAAQQNEARQRAAEVARERANDAQRQQAAENARARAMEQQHRAQENARAAAQANAQRESQQRAAAEAASRRQSEPRPQRSDDDKNDKNDKKKGR